MQGNPDFAEIAGVIRSTAQAATGIAATGFHVRVRTATGDHSYFAQDTSSVGACLSAIDAECDAPCGITVKPAADI